MWFPTLTAVVVLFGMTEASPTASNQCNVDNCYRQVKASNFPSRPTVQDCSSFLKTTVTPSAVTSTVTASQSSVQTQTSTNVVTLTKIISVTGTETDITTQTSQIPTTISTVTTITAAAQKVRRGDKVRPANLALITGLERRATSTNTIPAYASGCSASSAYSSACSCALGIVATTVTAPTPTSTVTITHSTTSTTTTGVTSTTSLATTTSLTTTDIETTILSIPTTITITSTSTIQPVPTYTCANFILQAVGGQFDGQYAYTSNVNDGYGDYVISFTSSLASATTYNVDKNSHLNDGQGHYANVNTGASQATLYFSPSVDTSYESYANCDGSTGVLVCAAGSNNEIQECPSTGFGGIELNPSPQGGCTAQTLQVINYLSYSCT